jgi:hypothetical protein
MEASFHVRRSAAVFLLAIVLISALTCSVSGVAFFVLIPLLFFVATVIPQYVVVIEEPGIAVQRVAFPAFSPRPPPFVSPVL